MPNIIEQRKIRAEATREITKRIFSHENTILATVLVALIAGMAGATKGLTASRANMINILIQSSIRGVASMGQTFVILTGGIDLSVGGIGLFSSILGARVMATGWHCILDNPLSPALGVPLMLAVGLAWGMANGALISRIALPPLIVTLGIWEITKGVSFLVCQGTSLAQQPISLAILGQGDIGGIPTPIIIFISVTVISYFVLHQTTFGRSVYAVGGNPVSSWLSGLDVKRIIFAVYAISGFLAGISGAILTGRIMSASMQSLGGLELDSIAAVVIGGVSLAGGRGTVIGVFIGVLIISVINNGMSVLGADPAVQGIAKGAIIIGAVAIDFMRRRR